MCERFPGPRCSAHARPNMERAEAHYATVSKKFQSARERLAETQQMVVDGYATLDQHERVSQMVSDLRDDLVQAEMDVSSARIEFYGTPAGIAELREDIARSKDPDEVQRLEEMARTAKEFRSARKDALALQEQVEAGLSELSHVQRAELDAARVAARDAEDQYEDARNGLADLERKLEMHPVQGRVLAAEAALEEATEDRVQAVRSGWETLQYAVSDKNFAETAGLSGDYVSETAERSLRVAGSRQPGVSGMGGFDFTESQPFEYSDVNPVFADPDVLVSMEGSARTSLRVAEKRMFEYARAEELAAKEVDRAKAAAADAVEGDADYAALVEKVRLKRVEVGVAEQRKNEAEMRKQMEVLAAGTSVRVVPMYGVSMSYEKPSRLYQYGRFLGGHGRGDVDVQVTPKDK